MRSPCVDCGEMKIKDGSLCYSNCKDYDTYLELFYNQSCPRRLMDKPAGFYPVYGGSSPPEDASG